MYRYSKEKSIWGFIPHNKMLIKCEVSYHPIETWSSVTSKKQYTIFNVCYSKENVDKMIRDMEEPVLFALYDDSNNELLCLILKPLTIQGVMGILWPSLDEQSYIEEFTEFEVLSKEIQQTLQLNITNTKVFSNIYQVTM
jgi:hypothetical protein